MPFTFTFCFPLAFELEGLFCWLRVLLSREYGHRLIRCRAVSNRISSEVLRPEERLNGSGTKDWFSGSTGEEGIDEGGRGWSSTATEVEAIGRSSEGDGGGERENSVQKNKVSPILNLDLGQREGCRRPSPLQDFACVISE